MIQPVDPKGYYGGGGVQLLGMPDPANYGFTRQNWTDPRTNRTFPGVSSVDPFASFRYIDQGLSAPPASSNQAFQSQGMGSPMMGMTYPSTQQPSPSFDPMAAVSGVKKKKKTDPYGIYGAFA